MERYPPPPPHRTFEREQLYLDDIGMHTYQASNNENKQTAGTYKMTNEGRITAASNKKRHKQGKRQGGASQEQLETLRMMKHDNTRLVGFASFGVTGLAVIGLSMYRHT